MIGGFSEKGTEAGLETRETPLKVKRLWHFLPSSVLQVTGAGAGAITSVGTDEGAGVGA